MKPVDFDYLRARSVSDAIAALAESKGEAKLIAGGQSLGPMLNLRLARPAMLIDIHALGALKRIDDEGDAIVVGGAVTHATLEDGAQSFRANPMLPWVAGRIAYRAVRNRGTVGGSLAHADPAADWPLLASVLDAAITVRGPRGAREVRGSVWMKAAFAAALEPDELVEAVRVPKLSAEARWGYYKFCKKTGEFPEASAAVLVDPGRKLSRVVLGALDRAPQSLDDFAARLAREGAAAATDRVLDDAITQAAPHRDGLARGMHMAVLKKALTSALQ